MSKCKLCGKETTSSEPMVLVGNLCYIQPAGNGRAWSGLPPFSRFWKTFALLSVSVCPECQNMEANKLSNKFFKKDARDAIIKQYTKARKIPGEDILALPGQLPAASYGDIDMKVTMTIPDPSLGGDFKIAYRKFKLFKREELDYIGVWGIDTEYIQGYDVRQTNNEGLEEARLEAAALFDQYENR